MIQFLKFERLICVRINKKTIFFSFVIVLLFFFMFTYELPYYIYKPGETDPLEEMIEVEEGYESKGDFHLVTVSGGQATPLFMLMASLLPYHDIVPLEDARPDGISDEEYMKYQLKLMENSHQTSTVVAYRAANEDVEIIQHGVYIMDVVKGMPAEGILQTGDRVIEVDGIKVKEALDLVKYVEGKQSGEEVEFFIERDGVTKREKIKVVAFPDQPEKVGIGVRLVNDQEVEVKREVEIKSGKIGGPSAGLMFALEMYDKLVEEDITKGYKIAGTGEIDFEGNVLRIGGVDKKVVAADKNDIEIFFVPYENGRSQSNYEEAKETAEKIKSTMKIVPVDTFDDALKYLDNLTPKE